MRIQPGQWKIKLPVKAGTLHVTILIDGDRSPLIQKPFGGINELRKDLNIRGMPCFFEQWMNGKPQIRIWPAAQKTFDIEIQNLPSGEVW